jgi:low affinity Fe/Cu permease
LRIKLSELILALEGTRNELAAVEKQPQKALENIAQDIHARANADPLTMQSNKSPSPRESCSRTD